MSRRIEVDIDGVTAIFSLLEEWAQKATSVLWDALPLENQPLRQAKFSGDACFVLVEHPALRDFPARHELGVTSIYRGYMVADIVSGRGTVELLISYGSAEYRGPQGRQYATPVAEVEGDASALYAALQSVSAQGPRTISLRRRTTD